MEREKTLKIKKIDTKNLFDCEYPAHCTEEVKLNNKYVCSRTGLACSYRHKRAAKKYAVNLNEIDTKRRNDDAGDNCQKQLDFLLPGAEERRKTKHISDRIPSDAGPEFSI